MGKGYTRRQILAGAAGITGYGALGIEAALDASETQESHRWRLEGNDSGVKYILDDEEDIVIDLKGLEADDTEAILEAKQGDYHETLSLSKGVYDGDNFGEIEGLPDFELYEVGDFEQSWGSVPYVEMEFDKELKGQFL